MNGVACPECSRALKLGSHPHRGQRIVCPRCKRNLVVVDLNPINLDLATSSKLSARPKKKAQVVTAACPECDHLLKLSPRSRAGEQMVCDACDTMLEVVSTDPLELDVATLVDYRRHR